ncbi:MAG: hypothetical protein U1F83_04940 [Verrucomicrobiota bacterium]
MIKRLTQSTVVWSWVLNGLRAGSGVIVLPILFRVLSKSELGMNGVLLSLASLALIVDFGFGPTIDRFISYAMGGAKTLEAHGVPEKGEHHQPNFELLWELLETTRRLYRYLSVILFFALGLGGTFMVEKLIHAEVELHPDFPVTMARLAWAATFLSTLLDIYSNWWGIYLRGMNEVRAATKVAALAALAKFGISVGLLLSGAGLLSLPLATMVSSYIQRRYARVRCLQLLPARKSTLPFDFKKHFAVMWPNSWRLGMQLMSTYLITQVNTLVCAHVYHLEVSGAYTYSVQLMGYASMMAVVWTFTKWPLIGQYQARHDYAAIQRILRPRIWLQTGTYFLLACGVVFVAPDLLHWIGKGKELLPTRWLLCLMFSAFMDMQLSTCGTLISTGNRLPFIWPGIVTNFCSMIFSLTLLRFTSLGPGSFVLGPICSGVVFNYWYWPPYAARAIKTTLFRLLFAGPEKSQPAASSAAAPQ